MRCILALLVLLISLPAMAEEVVLGMSQDQVSISTDFNGDEILIFGAIKRESPISETPMQVIVTVAGPDQQLTVRKKARRFGIWVNTETVEVDAAPSFYAVNTTAPWADTISEVEDLRHHISIPRAIRAVGTESHDSQSFTNAVIRIRKDADAYQLNESSVDFREQTLFRTSVVMPANLTEGNYPTRVFLLRDKQVVSHYETTIAVRKVGLERWLYSLARNQPLLYGLMSLAIAIFAGWGASAAFQALRSQ
ncbi:MAG: TIGR02186 family protein [Pelagimonas sp.]|jgi:uncharacterized protein (TIGR02186 family)|nr:TIGR02186 family protein [Pelagimonas sp.]